jgi:succinoglycan biosynthesis transport protein ExoP
MEILHLYSALIRRKWLIIESVAFFLAAAVAITMLLPKQYQATAKLIVESSDTTNSILSELGLEEVALSLTSSSDDMMNKIALATMRPVLEEVIWKLQLRDDNGRLLLPDKLLVAGTVDQLMGAPQLKVAQAQGTDILMVTATSSDAEQSRLMADTLAQAYISQSQERARSDVREASRFVTDQLALVESELDEALASIAEVQQDEEIIDLESEVKAAVARISEMMLALEQTGANIQGLRAQIIEEQRNQSREDIELVSPASLASNSQIRSLRDEVAELRRRREAELLDKTERHPDLVLIDKQIEATTTELELALREQHELSPVIAQLRSQLVNEQERSLELRAGIERATVEFGHYPDKMRRLAQLELAAEATEKLFTALQQQQFEIAIAEALTMSDLQFVEPAVEPGRPAKPRLVVNVVAGLMLGLMFGVAMVFGFEYLDDSIKTPDELREVWDLPQLGAIPHYGKKGTKRLITDLPAHAPVAEAFRTVRNSIAYATLDKPPRYVAVSSGVPEEGKSTVSMNLAISMARDGKRVVLVDCDLRRPTQHRFFPHTANHVGVTNVLLGEARLEDAYQEMPVPGFRLLAAGTLPRDPGSLVESLKMRQLLMDVARTCDIVIVDTPPVMVVNDAIVLGRQVDEFVLVAEAGRASRKVLRDVRNRMEGAGLIPVGLVLNKLDTSDSALGGYYRYYRSYYIADKDADGKPLKKRRRSRKERDPEAGSSTQDGGVA